MLNLTDLLIDKPINENNIFRSADITESYVNNTLLYVSEMNKEISSANMSLYKNILEAETYEVVNESFSEFFATIKIIIENFLKYIRSLIKKFNDTMYKMISSDKYLIKNKNKLTLFSDKHDFYFNGYEFTISNNIPVIETLAHFNQDFVNLDISKVNVKDKKEALNYISKLYSSLTGELKENYYDFFRGTVINKENYPISASEFASELFRLFRNGSDSKSKYLIDKSQVVESLNDVENYKTIKSNLEKDMQRIESDYNRVKKQVDNIISRNRDNDIDKLFSINFDGDYIGNSSPTGVHVTEEVLSKLNSYIKATVNKVSEMSNIHSIALSYKLEAIKDKYIQDKKILYNALSEIQKDKSLR